MEEFRNKLGLKIEFSPPFSPWSNGINERSHYSSDVAVRNILDEDANMIL